MSTTLARPLYQDNGNARLTDFPVALLSCPRVHLEVALTRGYSLNQAHEAPYTASIVHCALTEAWEAEGQGLSYQQWLEDLPMDFLLGVIDTAVTMCRDRAERQLRSAGKVIALLADQLDH